MRHLGAIGGLVILFTGGEAAMAQAVPDLKGTRIPAKGAHLVEGPTKHQQSGTVPVPGGDEDAANAHLEVRLPFRTTGRPDLLVVSSSAKVSEKFIGAISVDWASALS